jgi:beta-fructofuranosidase
LTAPGNFAQVECPQLSVIDGRRLILFSCLAEDHSTARRERIGTAGVTGTFVLTGTADGTTFTPSDNPIAISGSDLGPLYAGKLVEIQQNDWRFLAFRGGGDREFIGELTDPLPINVGVDNLEVVLASPAPIGG